MYSYLQQRRYSSPCMYAGMCMHKGCMWVRGVRQRSWDEQLRGDPPRVTAYPRTRPSSGTAPEPAPGMWTCPSRAAPPGRGNPRGNPSNLATVQEGRLAGFIWGAKNQERALSAGSSLQQHLGTVSGEGAREIYFFRSWQRSAPMAGMQRFPRPGHLLSAGKAQGAFAASAPGQGVSNRTVRRGEGRLLPPTAAGRPPSSRGSPLS